MVENSRRPGVAVGHLFVSTSNLEATLAFFDTMQVRTVVRRGDFAVLEVRGGTHLVVRSGANAEPAFDLMVDDVDETSARLRQAGFEPTKVDEGRIHRSFSVSDGAGIVHRVTSSHVVGSV